MLCTAGTSGEALKVASQVFAAIVLSSAIREWKSGALLLSNACRACTAAARVKYITRAIHSKQKGRQAQQCASIKSIDVLLYLNH